MAEKPEKPQKALQDIPQVVLSLILQKLKEHEDKACLTESELDSWRQHERYLRLKRVADDKANADKAARERKASNAKAFEKRLAGMVATRDKAAIKALIQTLEGTKHQVAAMAEQQKARINEEIRLHQERLRHLKAAAKEVVDTATIEARVTAAREALISIDDANKCPHCGVRLSNKRNLDDHLLKCKERKK